MKKTRNYHDYLINLFPDCKNVINVTIQVTDACNLACSYCYQINKGHHTISLEHGKKFIDMLLEFNNGFEKYYTRGKLDGIILEFIGGEPLLEINLIDKLTDYFINRMIELEHPCLNRYRISICSNGVLYFQPEVQAYIKKNLNHLSFSISIDGNKELHDACRKFPNGKGSYDIAIAGVKHYMEELHGFMGSKMTLAPENIQYTSDAVISLIENNYKEINLNCVYEADWNIEQAKILYNELKTIADYVLNNNLYDDLSISMFREGIGSPMPENHLSNFCGGTGAMISIDYKGDVYPCIRYMESSLGNDIRPLKIGNIDTGLMVTEEQINDMKCLQCITRRSQSTDECFYCPIGNGCSWCSAYNYQCFGTADKRTTTTCVMHQARTLGNIYYWNQVYRKQGNNKRMKIYIPEDWALKIIDQNEWNKLKELEEN